MGPRCFAVAVLLWVSDGTSVSDLVSDTADVRKEHVDSSRAELVARMEAFSAVAAKVFTEAQQNQADPGVLAIIQKIGHASQVFRGLDETALSSSAARTISLLEQETAVQSHSFTGINGELAFHDVSHEDGAVDSGDQSVEQAAKLADISHADGAVNSEDQLGELAAKLADISLADGDPTALDAIRQAREAAERSRSAGVSTWGKRPAADEKTVNVLRKIEDALENHPGDQTATGTATTTTAPSSTHVRRRRRRHHGASLLELETSDKARELEVKLEHISMVAAHLLAEPQRHADPLTLRTIQQIKNLAETSTSARGSVKEEAVGRRFGMRSPRYAQEQLLKLGKQAANRTERVLFDKTRVDKKLSQVSSHVRDEGTPSSPGTSSSVHSVRHSSSPSSGMPDGQPENVQGSLKRAQLQATPHPKQLNHDPALGVRRMTSAPIILRELGQSSSAGTRLAHLLEQAELKGAHPTTLNAIRKFQEAV